MIPTGTLTDFAKRLASKDGRRAVSESDVRSAIAGYARCIGIVNGVDGAVTKAQLDRAVRHYHETRARLTRQISLLSA
jgi:hypothetical protein